MTTHNNLLEASNVSFTYPGGIHALSDINLSIRKGEFVGILGANGSGKTTLLKLLNGLLKPTKGGLYLEQEDIKDMDRDALFSKICTCFQNPEHQLFSPTVAEDIAFGPRNLGLNKEEIQRKVDYAISAVGMPGFGHRTISSLSYGQKKRICLAGVLAMSPRIILLDEPTDSLDPQGVLEIMHLLKDLNTQKNITMIMSTHSIDLVPVFIDRVVVMHKGKIISDGVPQVVFSDSHSLHPVGLRLPEIGQLFEALKKEDGLGIDGLPLTVGEARAELRGLLNLRGNGKT